MFAVLCADILNTLIAARMPETEELNDKDISNPN
jgi:hypothetical protein